MALLHEAAIRVEMRRICSAFPKDELFFAIRMWTPGQLAENGFSFGEDAAYAVVPRHEMVATMGLRRVATAAVLLYGAPVPRDRISLDGNTIPPARLGLFVACFAALMALSYAYLFWGMGPRALASTGSRMVVDEVGLDFLEEDKEERDVLTFSCDNRRHMYFDLLSRVGEFADKFADKSLPILEPYEEVGKRELVTRSALYTAWYEPDLQKTPGYRMFARPLDHVEALILELDGRHPDAAREAWGFGFKEFVALLGGFSRMVGDRLASDRFADALGMGASGMPTLAFMSATLPFFEPELEGDGDGTLISYAADYAVEKGLDHGGLDLRGARRAFLDLAVSKGKKETGRTLALP